MRSFIIVSCLALGVGIALAKPPSAKHSTGGANLHQINKTGIRARIEFIDHGDMLEVRGTATGLDPKMVYFSLVYDSGAKPSGKSACIPSMPGALTRAQMSVDTWTVDDDGNGTLHAFKGGPAYVALDAIGAMSIRNAANGALQACGKVTPANESARTCRVE